MSRVGKPLQVLAAVAAVLLALAACSSKGGAQNSTTQQDFTIAMVTHEAPGDTFWDKIRNGAEAAAKQLGVTLKYSNDPDSGKQATLVQNAIDSKVDDPAVTLPDPPAIGPTFQEAVSGALP